MVKQSGFTLVEVLVSMTIFTFIILIANSAFGFFMQSWDGKVGRFDERFAHLRTLMVFQQTVEGVVPYVAINQNNKPVLYFEGNPSGFVAVVDKSLKDPQFPAIIRVSSKQLEDFGFSLIYEEWVMNNKTLVRSGSTLPFSEPVVLAKDLRDITFAYFGRNSATANPQWYENFNSFVTQQHPIKMKLQIETHKNSNSMDFRLVQPSLTTQGILSEALDHAN